MNFNNSVLLYIYKTPADQRDIFRPKSFEQQNRFKSKNLYKYISHGTNVTSTSQHQIFDEKFDQEPENVRIKMADLAGP